MRPMRHLRFWSLLLLLGTGMALATDYRVTLLPESYIEYLASDSRESFRGRAPVENLTLRFDDTDPDDFSLEVVLDPARFDSGRFIRDTNARRTVFETDRFPRITFTGRQISASSAGLPPGETRHIQVTGVLEMHGVRHEVSVPVQVARSQGGDIFTATGSFSVLLSDYGMDRPSFLWLVVEDEISVSFVISGQLEP